MPGFSPSSLAGWPSVHSHGFGFADWSIIAFLRVRMIGSGCPALKDDANAPDLFLFLEERQRRHWIALKKSLWRFFSTADAEALDCSVK